MMIMQTFQRIAVRFGLLGIFVCTPYSGIIHAAFPDDLIFHDSFECFGNVSIAPDGAVVWDGGAIQSPGAIP